MPARCEQCGEEALTDTARFCVGCGAALPALDPREAQAERAPEPSPSPPRPTPTAPRPTPTAPARAPRAPDLPPLRDTSPAVPPSVVVAGVICLLALLLVLLLAA